MLFSKLAGTRRAKRNGREAGHPRWVGGRVNKGTYLRVVSGKSPEE